MENSTELKVESVSAINPTSIKVTFNEDVTEEALATSNFTLSKGTVEAVTASGKEAIISVKGLTYGDTTTVTVGNPAYTKEVTVPAVSDLFELQVTTDAEGDTLKSDGATKTQVTVTLIDKATGEVVDRDGIVQFQATDGGLGQTTSALVDGKATVQLTSVASATSITSILTATISDVPGAQEFKGLTAQKAVIFSPDGKSTGVTQFLQLVSAESTQGDRLFLTFSDKITVADYKKAATPTGGTTPVYNLNVDGLAVDVKDVVQKTDNTLEFILDVDNSPTIVAGVPTTNNNVRIEAGWAGVAAATQGNYLRDNVRHNVAFPTNVGTLVLANTSGVNFILTDTSRPAVYGVTAKDQLNFEVRFTESVDRFTAMNEANYLIDGKKVVVNAAPTPGQIATAKSNNEIIVTELTVGNYTPATATAAAKDERNLVKFSVHTDFAFAAGNHSIQIARVTDYAGDVDPIQNTIETDTFDFTVAVDTAKPVATITTQSPEQWLVTFDKTVSTVSGKLARDVFKIKTGNSDDAELVYGADFDVYVVSENGEAGTLLAPNATITNSQRFLIEFKQDWTVKYDTAANPTKTYFATTQNPYTVTLENVRTLVGNVMDKAELKVNLAYDGTSPTIVSATDVFALDNKQYNTNVLAANGKPTASAAVTGSGQQVLVKLSEPVKVNSTGAAPAEGLTASQDQATRGGVPTSTYEFVKGDKVVKANVIANSIATDDRQFVLQPETTLEAGEWKLNVRGLSDDIGNTIATDHITITIQPTSTAVTGTQIAWAAFDDQNDGTTNATINNNRPGEGNNEYDAIYVKFTKEMAATGANGVNRTQNYVFKGQPLPTGSQVLQGIKGVTDKWDGVTILVPKNTWDGTGTGNADFSVALNIASNFQAADGEKLSGEYEVELTDVAGTGSVSTNLEAIYRQDNTGVLFNGLTGALAARAAVLTATASDAFTGTSATATANGKIDTITLTTDQAIDLGDTKATKEIKVNGKTFVLTSTGSSTTHIYAAKTAGDEITGTDASKLVVTSTNGAVLVNTGSVVDAAAPVITKAQLNNEKNKITVTFSEPVATANVIYDAVTGAFESLVPGDFTLTITGGQTIGAVEHTAGNPSQAVLTLSAPATSALTSDTINAVGSQIFDFSGNSLNVPTTTVNISGAIVDTGITGSFGAITQGSAVTPAVPSTLTNQGVTYTAVTPGVAGDAITVALVDPSANSAALGVAVASNAITVNLATDGTGAITTTAADIVAAINGNSAASALVSASGTATTPVTAVGATNLASGAAATGTDVTETVTLTVTGTASATGTLRVVLTNPAKDVTVAVATGDTPTVVAGKIITALGTVPGYTLTNNNDGTITFTSTTANTNVADITVTVTNQ